MLAIQLLRMKCEMKNKPTAETKSWQNQLFGFYFKNEMDFLIKYEGEWGGAMECFREGSMSRKQKY